ncbi:type II/IV secretion system protein [Candidatus Saccharibacteria bacterium]|jgi:type IV pilus assembly protein PilB|nr:type II/IV secretion system protein [Candidatus Saccharibacteria bacterium]
MKIPDVTMQKILEDIGSVPPEKIDSIAAEATEQKISIQEIAVDQQLINETSLAQRYGQIIGIEYVSLTDIKIDKTIMKLVPERVARTYRAILFDMENDVPKIAMEDPDDLQAIDFIQKLLGQSLQVYVSTGKEIAAALEDYKDSIGSELSKVVSDNSDIDDNDKAVDSQDIDEDSPIAQTVNLLIEYAIKSKASDIHIEPRENMLQVRYRVDGVLREANKLPKSVMSALVSRIKILSSLKIDEHRAPQDGRFKISLNGDMFALRVSTLPVMDGEKVVMRILDESAKALTLDELGYWGHSLETIRHSIAQPHGIILVTGPTGSGKSTTLYSVLNLLNTPSVNISTIEDPVEYRIPGTNQTQVNNKANMTFASGLRALLRQDPNIIMVGEIRDRETANLAIQAALTGHLVFSTLHTNDAATALPRLLEMEIEPFLIASTVRAVIGQRLVRRLNPNCRESYNPENEQLEKIKQTFDMSTVNQQLDSANAQREIGKKAKDEEDIKAGKQASSSEKIEQTMQAQSSERMTLWRENIGGNSECEKTGFRGRIGIYEVLGVSEKIQNMIVANSTSAEIQHQAIKEGMITMQQDGFIKALQGITTIEEILRVTRE